MTASINRIIAGTPYDKESTVQAEDFSVFADNATLNSAGIKAAITYLGSIGGGRLEFNGAGTYLLDEVGVNPYNALNRYCIDITSDNIEIYISPASTLKLADGQQTDANGAVDIITWGVDRTNVKIHGGGEITGNTAGQTGWTGGYSQNSNGNIIESHDGGDADIYIGPLKLTDHFSNAVNLGRESSLNRLTNVTYDSVYVENTGEGQQIINCDGVRIINPTHVLSNGMTSAGDAVEVSLCTNFSVTDVRVVVTSGTPVGSAIDLFGSKHGLVDGFVIDGWFDACGLETTGDSITVDDVLITNGVVKNLTGTNVFGLAEGHAIYSNILVKDCASATLFQVNIGELSSQPPVEFHNVLGINCIRALIRGARKVIWHGGGNRDAVDNGVEIQQVSGAQTRNIDFSGLDFTNSVSQSIKMNDGNFTAMLIVGRMSNITCDDYALGYALDMSGLSVSGMSPNVLSNNGDSYYLDIGFYEVLIRASTDIDEMITWTRNQKLTIRATGSFSVIDRTSGTGVNIYLDGAADFAMTAGDRLVLEHDGTNWHELSRTIT